MLRNIIVSDQSGQSNIMSRLDDNMELILKKMIQKLKSLLNEVKGQRVYWI